MNCAAPAIPGAGQFQWSIKLVAAHCDKLTNLESIKWHLWHGNVYKALDEIQCLVLDPDAATFEHPNSSAFHPSHFRLRANRTPA